MKKFKYLMTALLVSLVAVTGCSKKNSLSPSEAVSKAAEGMQKADSYKMNIDMGIGFSMGDSLSFDTNVTGDSIADIKNGLTYVTMKINLLGEDVTTEIYTDTKSEEGKVITYTKSSEDDEWSKAEASYSDDNADQTKAFFTNLKKNKNIKELKSDKDNYNYEITITSDDFKELTSMLGETSDELDLTSAIKGDLKINVSIDKKTGNYSKLSIDMKDLLKNSMGDTEGVKVSKAEFVITISDYNSAAKITIPDDALNAKTNSIIDLNDNIINYFDGDEYDTTLTCSVESDDISSEITFGFNDDKYAKALEESTYTFETEEEADEFVDELDADDNDNVMVFKWDNEVDVTIYYDPEDDEKDYSYSDVKSMMEKDGYVCE